MAFTVSKQYGTVVGNKREVSLLITADAASGSVDTGLTVVEGLSMAPVSMATSGVKLKKNLSAASAAANGTIMVSSAANGDVFELICKGH